MIYYTRQKRSAKQTDFDISVNISKSQGKRIARFTFYNKKVDGRIAIGYDEKTNRLYFVPHEDGYKISRQKESGLVYVSYEDLVDLCAINVGCYDLAKDDNGMYIELKNRKEDIK